MPTPSSTRSISCGVIVWLVAWTLGASQGAFRPTDATALESRRTLDLGQTPTIVGNRLRPDLTLLDLAGASRPLRRRPAEVTLLNFWATWCVPCLKELPELVKLSHEWQGRGLEVVGIAVDSGKPVDIRAFAEQHGMDYSLLVATQRWTSEQFGVFGLPVTVVVDRTGRIRQRLIGPQTGPSFIVAVRPYL